MLLSCVHQLCVNRKNSLWLAMPSFRGHHSAFLGRAKYPYPLDLGPSLLPLLMLQPASLVMMLAKARRSTPPRLKKDEKATILCRNLIAPLIRQASRVLSLFLLLASIQ